MSTPWLAIMMMLICVAAQATEPSTAVYDRDPKHLWNRLYAAIAVRTEAGINFGIDNSEPFHDYFEDPQRLIAILDEFLQKHGEDRTAGNLRRALLLNDIWTAFDLAARPVDGSEDAALRRRLARVLARLSMQSSQISSLPDNYAAAVRSATFATDFNPEHPERAFLPPDLLDANGEWVEIGEDGLGAAALFHVRMLSGRSVFRVFIRCPGGRQATISYLEMLNLYPTPWALKAADIAHEASEPSKKVRWDPLRFDPGTPQFPPGTIVALVRQMMVIDDELKPVPTSITQKVQFRVFKDIGKAVYLQNRGEFNSRQLVYEFGMRRGDVLAGKAGGFHAVTPDETEYQLTTISEGGGREARLRGPVVLSTCARCHSANGIFSVNTYSGFVNGIAPVVSAKTNPQLLPAASIGYQGRATADWKTTQFNWGLLKGLLEAETPDHHPPH